MFESPPLKQIGAPNEGLQGWRIGQISRLSAQQGSSQLKMATGSQLCSSHLCFRITVQPKVAGGPNPKASLLFYASLLSPPPPPLPLPLPPQLRPISRRSRPAALRLRRAPFFIFKQSNQKRRVFQCNFVNVRWYETVIA